MRRSLLLCGAVAVGVAGGAAWWRRHRRFGSSWVNRVVDPWLVRHGILDRSAGEIGLIEHVGRTSGTIRRSPVHPVRTQAGFRIVVPLGLESQWLRNVLAAGRCRLQAGDLVYELVDPVLVTPHAVQELSPIAQHVMDWLGFRYLLLRPVAEASGRLDSAAPADVAHPPEGLVA